MEGSESIHIKISPKFRTLRFLPFTIAGVNCRCTLEIENFGKTKLPKTNFRWKIESEEINIGGKKQATGSFDNIYEIELEPQEKRKEPFTIKPFVSGHHRLIVGIPDDKKGGNSIVGEAVEGEVAGTEEQKWIRFHADPEMNFAGPWYTYFEVYSWYLLVIGLGTFSAAVLIVIEILKAIF